MADYISAYTGAQIDANLADADTAVQPGALATVATSGLYSDLSGTPTIPAAITVSDEGSSLTTAATSLNFTGAGVTATNTGGAVTVNVPGGGGGGGGPIATYTVTTPISLIDLFVDGAAYSRLYVEVEGLRYSVNATSRVSFLSSTGALITPTSTLQGTRLATNATTITSINGTGSEIGFVGTVTTTSNSCAEFAMQLPQSANAWSMSSKITIPGITFTYDVHAQSTTGENVGGVRFQPTAGSNITAGVFTVYGVPR